MITRVRLIPDVLLIDCRTRGACLLVEQVAGEFPKVGILGIVSALHHCQGCATRLTGTFHDPDDTTPDRIPDCADLVQRFLRKPSRHNGHATAN